MNSARFWKIIEQSRRVIDPDDAAISIEEQQALSLAALLSKRSPNEIISFNNHFQDRMIDAYDYRLWAALDLMGTGWLPEEYFHGFRSWLVSMGREVYEEALADPDSLAEVIMRPDVHHVDFGEFSQVIGTVYEQRTGQELPPPTREHPDTPSGTERSEDDSLGYFQRELPKLFAVYGEDLTEMALADLLSEDTRPVGQLPNRESLMKIDRFWQLIEASREAIDLDNQDGNMDRQISKLAGLLSELPPDEIVAFNEHMQDRMSEAYDWKLWAAAYLMEQGCSDDGFIDFRKWVISMGRTVYERALTDPDSLSEVARRSELEGFFFEEFPGDLDKIYEQKTGLSMPWEHRDPPGNPTGAEWDENDIEYFRREIPKLWALHGTKSLGRLSHIESRAAEQALIELHRVGKNGEVLLNKTNSISQKNPAK